MELLTVYENSCADGCNLELTPLFKTVIVFTIFVTELIIYVCMVKLCSTDLLRDDKDITNSEVILYSPCSEEVVDIQYPIEATSHIKIRNELHFFSIVVHCVEVDVAIVPLAVLLIDRQEVTYYIDGSYSHQMQIGHAGFRTSDGSSIVRRCLPQCPRRGSTESEVYAVCLALQHALDNGHKALTIYTDNSKVEQLLCRPREKDNHEYPNFCQTLKQCQQQNDFDIIRVERVRGHPTVAEQKRCEQSQQFARIDRLVRNKNRRYIRRQRIRYRWFYRFWYRYDLMVYYQPQTIVYLYYF